MLKDENQTESLICETGIGFSQRDANVKTEESKGQIEFRVIKNDGQLENLKLLTDLKNIISKQLPKMPKEYIVRLVFDKRHESMVIMKSNNLKVLGGVCYRPNRDQGFIEIAFLAISSIEQVKGYGTRLMNKLKDHCKVNNLNYFLTYADNNAIGYFKKQGFSNQIKLDLESWKDYIKDYDGGTLMEAHCNPDIDYSNLSENIKKQKEMLKKIILNKNLLKIKTKRSYNDLEDSIKSIKKTSTGKNDLTIPEEVFNKIPGIKESGWSYEDYEKMMSNDHNNINFVTQCKNIIAKVKQQKNSWPFHSPVDPSEVPTYKDVIKNPMDLQTLSENLDKGIYKGKNSFVNDLLKIFKNAKEFNKPNTIYHKYAVSLEKLLEDDIKNLKNN